MMDSLNFEVAGIGVSAHVGRLNLADDIRRKYQKFLSGNSYNQPGSGIDIHFNINGMSFINPQALLCDDHIIPIYLETENKGRGSDVRRESSQAVATVSKDFHKVRVNHPKTFSIPEIEKTPTLLFDRLAQMVLSHVFAQRQGALVHAAGIEISGKGLMFPAKAKTGKSTLTRQFDRFDQVTPLSDERIILRKRSDTFYIYGTPWHSEAGASENKNAPLSAIFFLSQSPENAIKEIASRDAFKRLLDVTMIPWYDQKLVSQMLGFCEDLLTRVPVFELGFKPDPDVVDYLIDFVSKM
jgi:hypothetical protein